MTDDTERLDEQATQTAGESSTGSRQRRRKSSLIRKLSVLAIATLIALLLCEGALRIIGFKTLPANPEANIFWRYSSLYGWHHRPSSSGTFTRPQFSTEVTINSKGLRDKEYPYERSEKTRTLVLGDSFVWGFGVERDEIFHEVMESQLSNSEFINAGVSGFGTDQQLLWLEIEGKQYSPDNILLVISGNDPLENSSDFVYDKYYKPVFLLQSDDSLLAANLPVPTTSTAIEFWYTLRQRSALFHLLAKPAIQLENKIKRSRGQLPDMTKTQQYPLKLTHQLLTRISDSAKLMNARLLIVVHKIYWYDYPDGNYESFVEDIRALGNEVEDLSVLKGYDPKAMQIQGDNHWNASGHKFVAKTLIERWFHETTDGASNE